MELKNKYSKQIIYSNQKFEDQIWYNQQIMTFLNFFTTFGKCFPPKFSGKHFPENQAKFFFDWKVFSIDQLSGRQTNTRKFGKWSPGKWIPGNKRGLKRQGGGRDK